MAVAETGEKHRLSTIEALQRLDDELTCTICSEPYQDPRMLQPCGHYYCKKCIENYVAKMRADGKAILCPECREPVEMGALLRRAFFVTRLREAKDSLNEVKGAVGIAKELNCSMCAQAQAIARCNTCQSDLCDFCVGAHRRMTIYRDHEMIFIATIGEHPRDSPSDAVKCSKHADRVCELFCSDCNELYCVVCALTRKHDGHSVCDADGETARMCKEKLSVELGQLRLQSKQISDALQKAEARKRKVSNKSSLVANETHEAFDRLAVLLNGCKDAVLENVYRVEYDKMTTIQTKEKNLMLVDEDVRATIKKVEGLLCQSDHGPQLLLSKLKHLLQSISSSANQCTAVDTDMDVDANLVLRVDESLLDRVAESYCQVQCELPDPMFCTVTGYGAHHAETSKETILRVTLSYGNGELCTEQQEEGIVASVTYLETGETIAASVRQANNSRKIITYTPTFRGRHEVVIKLRGHDINGSPFQVLVTHPPSRLSPQQGGRALNMSCRVDGIAMSSGGRLIVSEKSKGEVSLWDTSSGRRLNSIKLKSHIKQAKMCCPTGVQVDGHGFIYVCDNQSHHVLKFSTDGTQLLALLSEGVRDGEVKSPGGIRINYRGEILVCDCQNHRVQVFDSDLNFIRSFGRKGSGEGELNWPVDIAIDAAENLYISDMDNHRIVVYNSKGHFERSFGEKGSKAGQLQQPVFLHLDGNGYLYVSENVNRRVSVFRTNGEFVTVIPPPEGKDWYPKGITMDSDGKLYIGDRINQQIYVL